MKSLSLLSLTLILIISACVASPETTKTQKPISATLSSLKPILAPTPPSLPYECQIIKSAYDLAMFGGKNVCALMTLSPNQLMLAYLVTTDANKPVVKVIRSGEEVGRNVYQPQNWYIDNIEWSNDGKLTISDQPFAETAGVIVIYDPLTQKTITVNGVIGKGGWNQQHNAFYTYHQDSMSGACYTKFSIYDFTTGQLFTKVSASNYLEGDKDKAVHIWESPVWSLNGRELWLEVRSLHEVEVDSPIGKLYDYLYGPASIEVIDLSGSKPVQKTLVADRNTNYQIKIENGKLKIESEPYKTDFYCHR